MAGSIRSQEVFSFLRPYQVHTISEAAERLTVKPGDFVYEKGDKAADFFVVLDGEVSLRLPVEA